MIHSLMEKSEVGDLGIPSPEIAGDRFQLAIYDPTDPSDIEFVGEPFSGTPREFAEVCAAIRDYYSAIDGRDVLYSVGVFSIGAG